jgi:hypothetical protein
MPDEDGNGKEIEMTRLALAPLTAALVMALVVGLLVHGALLLGGGKPAPLGILVQSAGTNLTALHN